MKKTILLLFTILISSLGFAQDGFNYKALVTDNGTPVANGTIDVKVTIKAGSNTIWKEEHTNVQTDANGIFSITIGEGTRISGSASQFNDISWNENFTYKVEVDTGNGYSTMVSNIPFKFVPFAKKATALETNQDVIINQKRIELQSATSGFGKFISGGQKIYFGHYFLDINNGPTSVTDFEIDTNSNVTLHGKLLTEDTGNNDLKPIAYGTIAAAGGGSIKGGTENFTIHRMTDGYFKITLNNYTDLNANNTFIIATSARWDTTEPVICNAWALDNDHDFIYVKTFDSNNNLAARDFSFVIYKK